MNFKGKYEALTEATMVRYQSGGFLVGDQVKINKNALNHPKLKEKADHVKAKIKSLMDGDLNLKIAALKSIYPSAGDNAVGMGLGTTSSPDGLYADVVEEYAPGLFKNPVTLPIEVLEIVENGINYPNIPDSMKRKGDVNIKPKEVEDSKARMDGYSDTRTLPSKNTTLDYVRGSAKQPVFRDSFDKSPKNDEEKLMETYLTMNKSKNKFLSVSIANAFSDNIEQFLSMEDIKHEKVQKGHKTFFNVLTEHTKEELKDLIRKNVLGDMAFLSVEDYSTQV